MINLSLILIFLGITLILFSLSQRKKTTPQASDMITKLSLCSCAWKITGGDQKVILTKNVGDNISLYYYWAEEDGTESINEISTISRDTLRYLLKKKYLKPASPLVPNEYHINI